MRFEYPYRSPNRYFTRPNYRPGYTCHCRHYPGSYHCPRHYHSANYACRYHCSADYAARHRRCDYCNFQPGPGGVFRLWSSEWRYDGG